MSLDKILVSFSGILGVIFTYIFFFGRRETAIEVKDSVTIVVEGGYSPEVISIPKGKTTKINFLRKDPSRCLEEVVLGDFKIRRFLPLNQELTIEITPKTSGEFIFSCGMGMSHGKIIVK